MRVSRETIVATAAAAIGVGAMAIDHLVGTETEPGEDDAFPVDPVSFVVSAAIVLGLTVVLFAWLVRRAMREDPDRATGKTIAVTVLAVLTLPLLFLGLPFPFAGVGVALGLHARRGSRTLLATGAVALDVLVLALAAVAYVAARAS
jgi:hypothetical protein